MTARIARLLGTALVVVLVVTGPAAALERDVFDRPLPGVDGRPVVVLLVNRESSALVDEPLGDLTFELRDLAPVVIVRVDLRGIPSLFGGYARSSLRGSHRAGIERFRRQCATHGLPVPGDPELSLYFVAEPEGASHRAAGLPAGFTEPIAVVFDGRGRELARGAFPRTATQLEKALRRALEPVRRGAPVVPPETTEASTAAP